VQVIPGCIERLVPGGDELGHDGVDEGDRRVTVWIAARLALAPAVADEPDAGGDLGLIGRLVVAARLAQTDEADRSPFARRGRRSLPGGLEHFDRQHRRAWYPERGAPRRSWPKDRAGGGRAVPAGRRGLPTGAAVPTGWAHSRVERCGSDPGRDEATKRMMTAEGADTPSSGASRLAPLRSDRPIERSGSVDRRCAGVA
jgi:hypothetical protein